MRFKGKNIIFTFLYSLYPLVYLYLKNIEHLSINVIYLPLLLIGFLNLLLFVIFILISKFYKINNSKVIIPIVSILFFTYGLIHDIFYYGTISAYPFIHFLSKNIVLIPIYLILICALVYYISRKNDVKYLTTFLIILNLLPFQFLFTTRINKDKNYSLNIEKNKNTVFDNTQLLPDVYFIIADMYPSDKVLKERFNYDNTNFTKQLKQLGFILNEDSYSTYTRTLLSLSSTLNVNYLHEPNQTVNLKYTEKQLVGILQNNYVSNYFKLKGYQYYWFEGGYAEPDYNITKNDNYISLQKSFELTNSSTTLNNDFNLMFINASFITLLSNKINIILTETYRKRVHSVIKNLPLIAKTKVNKFVFAYLAIPHPPIIFDEVGNSKYIEEINPEFKTAYVKQVKYLNQQLMQMLKELKTDTRDKIIILQSDHGTRTLEPNNNYSFNEAWVKECLSNLNAIYFSDKNREAAYSHPNTINTFRYILREVFNEKLYDLPVYSYYTDYTYPIKLYRISN